jgi:hypothetical protein
VSVHIDNDRVCLVGSCPVEDAENLLQALQERAGPVDIGRAERLHTAVVQVLLAADREVAGEPAGAFLRLHLLPVLGASRAKPVRMALASTDDAAFSIRGG